ncbi:hypothetical protein ACJ2A9_03450 [Anaerobacillus sp. MEB173]|uniref:hypothetical protein n=1 Tax=Anaerobacillus sp. MEB173 TaxID=3383345 RepID=UPI003F931A48
MFLERLLIVLACTALLLIVSFILCRFAKDKSSPNQIKNKEKLIKHFMEEYVKKRNYS